MGLAQPRLGLLTRVCLGMYKERLSPPLCFRACPKFASQVQVRLQGESGGEHGLGLHFNCSPDVASMFQQWVLLSGNMGRDGINP